MAIIGTKWKLTIIYLVGKKLVWFGHIHAKMGFISCKVQTEQLKEMEAEGIFKSGRI